MTLEGRLFDPAYWTGDELGAECRFYEQRQILRLLFQTTGSALLKDPERPPHLTGSGF